MKNSFFLALAALSLQISTAQSTLLTITTDPDSKDAVVETYAPNLNGGSDAVVFVSAWTNGGTNNTKRYFIEFDLSAIPPNAVIDSAKVSFYKGSTTLMSNMHQGSNSWGLRRVTQSWTENTITWNNQPPSTSVNRTIVPATTSAYQNFPDLDVTLLIEDALTYGNFGFVAQLESEIVYKAVLLASSDNGTASVRPNLKVWYSSCSSNADFNYAVNSGNTVNFTNNSTSTGTTSYLWDFGDGTFSSLANPTKTYNQTGSFNVCLTITDTCGTETTCKTISLCTPANSIIYYSANGTQIQFQAQPSNALSYWWSFGDGNFTNLQNPLYTYPNAGTYTVCLATTDSCGTDTTCQSIYVSGIGLNENAKAAVTIYPNPTSGILHIGGINEAITKVDVYSISGQKLKELPVADNEIDISKFAKGMYFLHLNGETETKIIKVQKL